MKQPTITYHPKCAVVRFHNARIKVFIKPEGFNVYFEKYSKNKIKPGQTHHKGITTTAIGLSKMAALGLGAALTELTKNIQLTDEEHQDK